MAHELYGSPEKALGETLKIGGSAFKIVGVAERQDDDELEEGGTDDFVWMPYTVAVKMSRNASIGSYVFATKDVSDTEDVYKRQIQGQYGRTDCRYYG